MTDRYVALTVTLDHEIREEDAEPILDAIRMIKGVAGVRPVVADANTHWARENAVIILRRKLYEFIDREMTLK
jgi:hypothetical protein